MEEFLYNFTTKLYFIVIKVASLWHSKAKQIIDGQKATWQLLQKIENNNLPNVWVHCASVGEYEQALPIIEAIKQQMPCNIILTFFSSSGINAFKPNAFVTQCFYLPLDSKRQANKFVKIINPKVALFIKYELWWHYVTALQTKNIPTFLACMHVPVNKQWNNIYKKIYINMLGKLTHIFVQDEYTQNWCAQNKIYNTTVAGDTRYQRVIANAAMDFEDSKLDLFIAGATTVLIAGSTWPQDDDLLLEWLQLQSGKTKLVLVPHEVNKCTALLDKCKGNGVLYATANDSELQQKNVLIINTIGLLKYIYAYGNIAYVGGGFGNGIHNILEPLAYKIPVFFGPNNSRFLEAQQYIHNVKPLNVVVHNANDLAAEMHTLNNMDITPIITAQFLQNQDAVNKIALHMIQKMQ